MAKRVFFSFDYEDVSNFRVNVVRKHDMLKGNQEAGFFDYSIWEDAKNHGASSVKKLINTNLENTSTTCVLIGTDTWQRRWVRYEILKSHNKGNKLFGVHINGIKDKNQQTFTTGLNPFDYLAFVVSSSGNTITYYENDGNEWTKYEDLPRSNRYGIAQKHWGQLFRFSDWVQVYDWTSGEGYHNFSTWVENAT